MPCLRASIGDAKETGLPSKYTLPSSGVTAPHSALIRVDFPAVLVDGNLPSELRKILADRIATEMKNENLAGLVKPQIIEGSLGPKARPMGAVSLPLAKRYMLEA